MRPVRLPVQNPKAAVSIEKGSFLLTLFSPEGSAVSNTSVQIRT